MLGSPGTGRKQMRNAPQLLGLFFGENEKLVS